MKKRKIHELRASRGGSEGYISNFLLNMARSARLVHLVLAHFPGDKPLLKEASRSYVIALVSALETFLRDASVFVNERDSEFSKRIMALINEKEKGRYIKRVVNEGHSIGEALAVAFSFQNLKSVDEYYSALLAPETFRISLDNFELKCVIPAKGRVASITLTRDWYQQLDLLLEKRHELVHDANSTAIPNGLAMANYEALILTMCQLIAHKISLRWDNVGCLEMAGLPVLLTAEDLIRDDWQIVEESSNEIGIKIRK